MKTDKLLSSLCYFSVIFAPFLFPVIVFFLSSGEVRSHAGKSLWVHIAPYLSVFIGVGIGVWISREGHSTIAIIIIVIGGLIGLYYLVLNFVRGIRILIKD